MTSIMSIPAMKTVRKLAQKKHREKERLYLLEGAAAISDSLSIDPAPRLVLHDERAAKREHDQLVLDEAHARGIPLQQVELGELDRISGLKTTPPLVAVLPMPANPDPSRPPRHPLTLALDRVRDPGNLGTLVRAAAFYGIPELWLGRECADLFNPKTLRACMGAQLAVTLCREVDLRPELDSARGSGARVLAAVMEGDEAVDPVRRDGPPAVLLLGNEPHGIAPELVALASERVAIARRGPVDSLNVAMAGTVLIDRLLAR